MKSPNESTRLILVPEQEIIEIKDLLSQILKKVNGDTGSGKEWLSEEEARKHVPRARTWFFNMRKKGLITSTKVGGQPYYLKASLLKYIEKNRKDAYRND